MKKFRVSITDGFNSSEVGSTLTHICGNWNDSNSDYVFLECKDEDETYMIKNMENHAGVEEYNLKEVSANINQLVKLFNEQNNEKIVEKMKEIVPEFKSNNSIFEKLDK